MRVAMFVISPYIAWPAKGSAIRSTTKIAMILGTKTSVISWICVSACRRPMARPTTSAVTIAGAAISSSTQMASRAKSMVSAGVMVGGDHLVADGDHRIEREFGRVDGVDDADHIGLAGCATRRHLLAGLHGLDGVVHRLREELREVRRGACCCTGCGASGGARRSAFGADLGNGLVGRGGGGRHDGHDLCPYLFRRSMVRTSMV